MASLVLVLKGPEVDDLRVDSSLDHQFIRDLANYLQALASGSEKGTVYAHSSSSDPVAASATVTCATVSADDTVTIGATTLTAKASPSGENEFSQAGSDGADGDSLASKINAHSVLSKVVSASSDGAGVVTITALQRGSAGNSIALTSSNGTRLACTGSGKLASGAGGAEDAARTYAFGQ
jgi:phage tail sheath gpL-like